MANKLKINKLFKYGFVGLTPFFPPCIRTN